MAWLRDIDRWFIDSVLPSAPSYRALAAYLIGQNEADDLVQEAYVRVLSNSHWQDVLNAKAFTMQTIRHLALDRLRRSQIVRIEQISALGEFDVPDDAPGPEAVVAGRARLAQVIILINTLPVQCRRVVWMRKIDAMTPRAIAETLGLSVSTVEKHLAKGLMLVTQRLREEDGLPQGSVKVGSWRRRTRQL